MVRCVIDLVNALSANIANVRILYHGDLDAGELSGSVHCVRISPSGFLSSRDFAAEIAEHVDWADVVHLHQTWLWQNPVFARVAREHGTATVLSPHGMLDDWSLAQKRLKKKVFLLAFRKFFRHQVDCFHCTSFEEQRQVKENLGIPLHKSVTIPLFVDPEAMKSRRDNRDYSRESVDFKTNERVRTDVPAKILFLSRLHPKKGLEFLIDAVAELINLKVNVELIVAGPGDAQYIADLEARVAALGLTPFVRFLGMIQGEAKLCLMEEADVFVLPTFQENFGLVLIEAMCLGVPTITTRGTDIWKELRDAGALIVDRNVSAIALGIRDVIQDQTGCFRPNRTKLLEWLSPTRLSEQYKMMYEQVLSK